MVSVRLKMAMHPDFREKISYTMAVRGLLGGVSVMVRRMRAFAVPSEIARGGVLVAVAAASTNSSAWCRCLVGPYHMEPSRWEEHDEGQLLAL